MKKLITFLIVFYPFLTLAQKDSIGVSFTEEKAESFETTTLIDEYEKAFGNNRIVKSALRLGFNRRFTVNSLDQPYNFGSFMPDILPVVQFEQKAGVDKSLIAGFVTSRNSQSIIWNTDLSMEGRWYYEMKQRVASGKQQPNITGKYFSLKLQAHLYRVNPNYYTFTMENLIFRPTSDYSLNWGWQFGNNVNYGFSVGVKHGDKATINSEHQWVDIAHSSKTTSTWFVTTNALAGFGLYLPFKKKQKTTNSCEFLQCNYEVKELLKVNLNNVLYLDKYNQFVNLDVAYERKLGQSPFSINSNLMGGFASMYTYNITGSRTDTVYTNGGKEYTLTSYNVYSDKGKRYLTYSIELNEQLRYYPGMKRRIIKGKSAGNLNGTYVAATGSFKLVGINNFFARNSKVYLPGLGLIVGHQLQTNRRSFLDISAGFTRVKALIPDYGPTLVNFIFDFSVKLGFAR